MKISVNTIFAAFFIFAVSCSGETGQAEQQEGQSRIIIDTTYTTQYLTIYGIDKMKYVVRSKNEAFTISDSVTVNNEIYYILNGFNTRAGEELTITLTTISDLPAANMAHNWLLLKQKADASAFAMASIQARENDYVAPDKLNLVITETGLVAPDETATITFTTPQQSGEYEYICTFPGHFSAGMRGMLYVME